MKTYDLEEARRVQKLKEDDSLCFVKSRDDLVQYNQIKKILHNLTFKNDQKRILCNDIISDVLDECRKERKIIMVLNDDNVDEYVDLNMTEIDITTVKEDTNLEWNI